MALRSIENLQNLRPQSRRQRETIPFTTFEDPQTARHRILVSRGSRSRRQGEAMPFTIFEDPPTARPRNLTSRRQTTRRPRPFISTTATVGSSLADTVPSTTWGPFVETTDPTNPTVSAHFTAATITSFDDATLTSMGVMNTWRHFSLDNPRDPWAQYLAMALIRHSGYVRAFTSPANDQAAPMTQSHKDAYRAFRTEFERAYVERMDDTANTTTIPIPSPPGTTMQRLAELEKQLTKHAFLAWPQLWRLCHDTNQRLFVELTALFRILEGVVGAPPRNGRDGWERGMRMLRTWVNKVMLADWIELGDVLALLDTEQEREGTNVNASNTLNHGSDVTIIHAHHLSATLVASNIITARHDLGRKQKALDMTREHYEYLWRNGMGERMYHERMERVRSRRRRLEKERKDRETEDREKWRNVIMLR